MTKQDSIFNQALPIDHEVGNRALEATVLNNIGGVYKEFGESAKALESFNQALHILRAIGYREGEAAALSNIGVVFEAIGEPAKATEYYDQALPIYRAIKDREGEATTLSNFGVADYGLGERTKALEYFNQALPIFRSLRERAGEATILNNIGYFYDDSGERAKALDYYNQALQIHLSIGDREGEATALNNLGLAYYRLGQRAKSLRYYRESLPILRTIGYRAGEAKALANVADTYQREGDDPLAILFGKRAVNVFQSLRADARTLDAGLQKSYAHTVEGTYRTLADRLAAQGRIAEAQEVLDLLKDDEYFRLLRRRAGAKAETLDLTPVEAKWLGEYQKLDEPIGKLGAEKTNLERLDPSIRTPGQKARLVALDVELAQASKAFQTFLAGLKDAFAKTNTDDDRLKDVEASQALSRTLAKLPGTAAVYTLVTEDHVRTILCLPGAKAVGQAPAKTTFADLSKKVLAFRQALEDPTKDPRPLGAELYDLLIRPIEPALRDGKIQTLLWSLDSVLRYVPLWALYDRETGQYLVQKYPSALFTPRTVDRLAEKTEAPRSVAAFGVTQTETVKGLDGKDIEFPALPGVGAELAALGEAYPNAPKTDAAFTEAALLAGLHDHPSILHIATHFRFQPGSDADSFLLLGGNGKLTMEEFKNLPDGCLSDVDLLVLSACETAVGSVNADGSEFEGFSLLAQNKGAGTVLATLWPVSDDATAALMRDFYRLRKAHPDWTKLQCLTEAQLALITDDGRVKPTRRAEPATAIPGGDASPWPKDLPKLAHPYYWAPFVLVGNSR